MFIRKRDPRYKSHVAKQAAASASKPSVSNTPQRSTTPAGVRTPIFVEQDWQKPPRSNLEDEADLEWAAAEADGDSEEWECVACGKTFRSEAAWDSHERSRKHMQAVERLKREMLEEDDALELGGENPDEGSVGTEEVFYDAEGTDPVEEKEETARPPLEEGGNNPLKGEVDGPPERSRKKNRAKQKQNVPSRGVSPSPPTKTGRKSKGRRRTSPDVQLQQTPGSADVSVNGGEEGVEEHTPENTAVAQPELTKREKRRAKEAAKKAQATATDSAKLVCINNVGLLEGIAFN